MSLSQSVPEGVEPRLHAVDEDGPLGIRVFVADVMHERGPEPEDVEGVDIRPVVQQDRAPDHLVRAVQRLCAVLAVGMRMRNTTCVSLGAVVFVLLMVQA